VLVTTPQTKVHPGPLEPSQPPAKRVRRDLGDQASDELEGSSLEPSQKSLNDGLTNNSIVTYMVRQY